MTAIKTVRTLGMICTLLLASLNDGFSVQAAQLPTELVFSDIVEVGPSSMMAQRILIEAYGQLGIKIKILTVPNLRTKSLLETKAIDGLVFRLSDKAIFDLQPVQVPITYEEMVVFSVKKRFTVNGYQSLQNYTIGYLSGARVFEERLKDMRVDTAPSEESLLKKLAAGRTDVVVDTLSSLCMAKKLGLKEIVVLQPSLEKFTGYHWISARHQAIIPKLETVLKKMSRDGSIKTIQERAWREFNAGCKAYE